MKPVPFTGMGVTSKFERKAQSHLHPISKLFCSSQSPTDLARQERRFFQAAARDEAGEALNGKGHASGPAMRKPPTLMDVDFLLEWRGGHVLISKQGKWAILLAGPHHGPTFSNLSWYSVIGLSGAFSRL